MKRGFWYDGSDLDREIADFDVGGTGASKFMKHYSNVRRTENGAVGYATTMHPLLDLNFKVSSLRNREEAYIADQYVKAYYDAPEYAVKWLFYLRDIAYGLGERRTFRICLEYLAQSHPDVAESVMPLVPEYGRYDDLLVLLDTPLRSRAANFLKKRLDEDRKAMKQGKRVSLLAKWLPSINTSSRKTRNYAYCLASEWNMTPREYRKALASLRSYGSVLEVKMSSSRWNEINYEGVPAKANLKYEKAFERHDAERRADYLHDVLHGDSFLPVRGIMPYEIVRRYRKRGISAIGMQEDLLAELMWKKLSEEGMENPWGLDGCLVVADGSGSMYGNVADGTGLRAIDICHSLAIYFAGQLKGIFHDKAVTFSARPQLIDLDRGKNLKEKLEIMNANKEMANTNIEAVFNMLLAMAKSSRVPADEIPKQVLVISDMEFDEAQRMPAWCAAGEETQWNPFDEALFQTIERKYALAGYPMPRLIFWNVCGRTDTIPMVSAEQGICLLSGFSQNAIQTAQTKERSDPYKSLLEVLDKERYRPVAQALKTG